MNPDDAVICYSDRYTPTADEFASVDEFLVMCRKVFGEAPKLTLRADGWHDDQGLVLTETPVAQALAAGVASPQLLDDVRAT